ncbi:MAG: Oligosaccharide translocation protein rft1 [Icmadophila ericetorum]|nr:Oligosaccharide translocation protein rft1 [Icmadophila ericetorum]
MAGNTEAKMQGSTIAESQSLLAKSAQGATFLISLQVGSRAITFIVNQILLRYLSPELLGISAQLELFSITVLYFARDSLRVALQRHTSDSGQTIVRDGHGEHTGDEKDGIKELHTPLKGNERAQAGVNISYIAISLGPPLIYILAGLYTRRAEPAVLATPYIHESLYLFAFAAFLELFIEPCFVVAQQQMLYGVRASAEASATFTRCIATCGMAIWASSFKNNIGVLPFAIGQLGYALALNLVYYFRIWSKASNSGFSLFLRPLQSSSTEILLSLFPLPTVSLAINLYAQSGLKHLLTQGDSLLIALFTSLSSQGIYALASNYGSLIARMLFQPIEESSRGVFSRLLTPVPPPPSDEKKKWTPAPRPTQSGVLSAKSYLLTVLHIYSLISLFILTVGPTLAPLLLRYIAGSRWTQTSAGSVLGLYCYYIPLLAFNGILEAFVSSTASTVQLRTQSMWMFTFSAGFAATGYMTLKVYNLGAQGLVVANAVNMAMRILWSWGFVRDFFEENEEKVRIGVMLPGMRSSAVSLAAATYMRSLQGTFDGSSTDLVKTVVAGGIYGVVLLVLERQFLLRCYYLLKPSAKSMDAKSR